MVSSGVYSRRREEEDERDLTGKDNKGGGSRSARVERGRDGRRTDVLLVLLRAAAISLP